MTPYGLTKDHIRQSVKKTESFFLGINQASTSNTQPYLLDILATNSVSGLVSDLMINEISALCSGLGRNTKTGGYPDLLPVVEFEGLSEQRAASGIEVKASKKNNVWQGHNVEEGWLLAIKYTIRKEEHDIIIDNVYLANLSKEDWTFCPRGEKSRRTPTATINKAGTKKLKDGEIYSHGE